MRARLILASLFLGISALLFLDPSPGLTQGKGKGPGDPAQIFERLANGRDYFLISETRWGREALTLYAQKNGITDEKITKEHYLKYSEEMRKGLTGGNFNINMFKRPSGPPGSGNPAVISIPGGGNTGAFNPVEAFRAMADAEFKRRDTNDDGKLNYDEMPGPLREDLARWDTNRDGLIDID